MTLANDSEYGLVAYLHSEDPRRIYRLSRALRYGMIAVNRTKVTGAPIPFGGMKQSGIGREGAADGMRCLHGPQICLPRLGLMAARARTTRRTARNNHKETVNADQ